MFPTHHKTICASGYREKHTLVIMGTKEQIELMLEIAGSVERGTLIPDMQRLLGRKMLGLEGD